MESTLTAEPRAKNEATSSAKDPVHTIRVGHGISLAIYHDVADTKDGRGKDYFYATIRKAYRKADGKWGHVRSFYPNDWLLAGHAFSKAFDWWLEQERRSK